MATATWESGKSYFYFYMNCNVHPDGKTVDWDLWIHHSKMSVSSGTWECWVNGNQYVGSLPAISSGSGSHDTLVDNDSLYIEHTSAVTIGFSFSADFNWNIGGTNYTWAGASGELGLPSLAVAPSPPSNVSVTGGTNGYLLTTNPYFNVSWSGASRGTYDISQFNIDVSKDNWASLVTPASLQTTHTSGSIDNVNAGAVGLNGGETVKIRVAMWSSYGQWQWTDWGGSFTAVRPPTKPTLTVTDKAEIDTDLTMTWSAVTAGSLGLAGYDLQVRGYDGTSWSSWVIIYAPQNVTSYNAGTPKNLEINGVNYYETYGLNSKFQYRVRSSDGIVGTSEWDTSPEISILINQPTQPRK